MDWNSDVREVLDGKINDLKSKINTISLQSTNLKTIVSYCNQLKEKITKYNEMYNSITNATMHRSLSANATEEEKTVYNSKMNEYNANQRRKTTLSNLVQEIERTISLLKSVSFDGAVSTVSNINPLGPLNPAFALGTNTAPVFTGGLPNVESIGYYDNLISGLGGSNVNPPTEPVVNPPVEPVVVPPAEPVVNSPVEPVVVPQNTTSQYTITYDDIAYLKVSDLNDYFGKRERDVQSNISALELSMRSWQNLAHLSSIVGNNMKGSDQLEYQVAVRISEKSNPKFNKLRDDAEYVYNQQKQILNIYKDANHNGFITMDGYLRQSFKTNDESKIQANIDTMNGKIASVNPTPLEEVVAPQIYSIVKGEGSIVAENTNVAYAEGLFIEALYNSPREGVTLNKNYDSNNQVIGYTLTDNTNNKSNVYITDLEGNVVPVK